jgi:hypothetical protein
MEPVDFGDYLSQGVAQALRMVVDVFTNDPWLLVLFMVIIAGALYLQLSSPRRRRSK